jgi:hypothetical protein
MARRGTIRHWAVLCVAGFTIGFFGHANAQSSKTAIDTLAASSFQDNSFGAITPAAMRAFLGTLVPSFQQYAAVNAQVGTSYTVKAEDYGQLVTFDNSAAVTVTLPSPTAAAGFYPFSFYASNLGTGTATLKPPGGVTINGASNLALVTGQTVFVVADGSNYQIVAGGQNNLTLPVSVANGGTGASSAGATAANNIGALAEASNLSDLASASSARSNLGLGALATLNQANPGTTGNGGLSAAAGHVNVLRNSSLAAWFHGCVSGACTATTTAATSNWCAEGVFVIPTGANITCQATTTAPAGNPGYYALKIVGAASNTDIKVRFVVESYIAARLAGLPVTFQFVFINNSGGSITPALSTKYATTQDGGVTAGAAWGASTTDLSATNLTACPNTDTCTEAYTLTASANAVNGYEFVVDFGAIASNTDNITIGAGFDARTTPGISTGINVNPPAPEVRAAGEDILWCQRFYTSSYGNFIAPGASTHAGIVPVDLYNGSDVWQSGIVFGAQMRSVPTIAYWDGAGNASKFSYVVITGNTSFTDDGAPGAGSGPYATGPGGTAFYAWINGTSGQYFVHYTADASIWGG